MEGDEDSPQALGVKDIKYAHMLPPTSQIWPGFSQLNILNSFEFWVIAAVLGWVPPKANAEVRIQELIVYLENARTPVGERGGEAKWEAVNDRGVIKQLPRWGDQSLFPWANGTK